MEPDIDFPVISKLLVRGKRANYSNMKIPKKNALGEEFPYHIRNPSWKADILLQVGSFFAAPFLGGSALASGFADSLGVEAIVPSIPIETILPEEVVASSVTPSTVTEIVNPAFENMEVESETFEIDEFHKLAKERLNPQSSTPKGKGLKGKGKKIKNIELLSPSSVKTAFEGEEETIFQKPIVKTRSGQKYSNVSVSHLSAIEEALADPTPEIPGFEEIEIETLTHDIGFADLPTIEEGPAELTFPVPKTFYNPNLDIKLSVTSDVNIYDISKSTIPFKPLIPSHEKRKRKNYSYPLIVTKKKRKPKKHLFHF